MWAQPEGASEPPCSCCSVHYAVWNVQILRWRFVILNSGLFQPSCILITAQLLRIDVYEEPLQPQSRFFLCFPYPFLCSCVCTRNDVDQTRVGGSGVKARSPVFDIEFSFHRLKLTFATRTGARAKERHCGYRSTYSALQGVWLHVREQLLSSCIDVIFLYTMTVVSLVIAAATGCCA